MGVQAMATTLCWPAVGAAWGIGPYGTMLLWLGLGLILVGVGAVLFFSWFRKKYRSPRPHGGASVFSVEDVERLYKAGTISKEEFARLRRIALGLPAVARKQNQPAGQGELNEEPQLDDNQAGDDGGEGNLRQ
jgi:hypothetical protein